MVYVPPEDLTTDDFYTRVVVTAIVGGVAAYVLRWTIDALYVPRKMCFGQRIADQQAEAA